jgi:hypothetical protein
MAEAEAEVVGKQSPCCALSGASVRRRADLSLRRLE